MSRAEPCVAVHGIARPMYTADGPTSQVSTARTVPMVAAVHAVDGSGTRLARHLTVVVAVKVLALTLLWAIFFRAAP